MASLLAQKSFQQQRKKKGKQTKKKTRRENALRLRGRTNRNPQGEVVALGDEDSVNSSFAKVDGSQQDQTENSHHHED